jgi:hypothetical protein
MHTTHIGVWTAWGAGSIHTLRIVHACMRASVLACTRSVRAGCPRETTPPCASAPSCAPPSALSREIEREGGRGGQTEAHVFTTYMHIYAYLYVTRHAAGCMRGGEAESCGICVCVPMHVCVCVCVCVCSAHLHSQWAYTPLCSTRAPARMSKRSMYCVRSGAVWRLLQ